MCMVKRTVMCTSCKKVVAIEAPREAWNMWENNIAPVQVCFPDLPADVREMLTFTGMCGECFDKLFE